MATRPLSAIVLAAGKSTRMKSTRPKPLPLLCGPPMVLHILDALAELQLVDRAVIVVGHGAERVTKSLSEQAKPDGPKLEFVEQAVQRGTGDATAVGLTAFTSDEDDLEDGDVLV